MEPPVSKPGRSLASTVAGPHDHRAMTTLSTERLTLRPWRLDDAEVLLEMRGNPDIAKWLGSPEPWSTLDKATNEIAMWQQRLDGDPPLGTWAIVPADASRPVGSVGLSRIRLGDEIEVGWYLHPDAVGQGWAAEAAEATIRHGLSNGIERIWALMWRNNEPSAKVARRIGMRELGVLVDPWYGSEQDAYSRMFVARPDMFE